MQFEGAIIKEQGQTFAIVIVKPFVLRNPSDRDNFIARFKPHFSGIPLVLLSQDSKGIPTYYGRKDIVKFLSRINMSQIPWKRYTLT